MNPDCARRPSTSPLGLCLAALALTLGPAPESVASDNAIVTDRPTFVASTTTVGEHNIQIETGVQRIQDGEDLNLLRTWTTPTLIRLGTPRGYELRVQTEAFTRVRTIAGASNGMADLELGVKGQVPGSLDPRLSLAWMAQALVPTGSERFRTAYDGVRPSLRLAAAWQLPQQTSVGVMPGIRWDQDAANERFFTGMLGVNVARVWNPRLRSYAEMTAREIREQTRGGKNMVWDVGSAWHVQPDTQLDAAVGFGLKDNDTDLIWTVGLSRRFTPSVPGTLGSNRPARVSKTSSENGQ